MKKPIMCFIGTMMILSLAACTPTTEKYKTGEVKETQEITDADKVKLPDATAPELDIVSVYTVKADGSGLDGTMDSVEAGSLDENSLVGLLIQYGVLDEGTEVVEFNEGQEQAALGPAGGTVKTEASLDLSRIPDDGKNEMIVKAIAKTFMENMNMESITIKLNGAPVAENLSLEDVE